MQAAFFIQQLRYQLTARSAIDFGAAGAANGIRGQLGWRLRRTTTEAIYQRIFEPRAAHRGPSGLADSPRPFVLRASHLDGRRLEPGETFAFDVHLFNTGERAMEAINVLNAAFADMAELETFETTEIRIDLALAPPAISRIQVDFLTPTELKGAGATARTAEFALLFARVRDRVATLQSLYGGGPLDVNFKTLGERAQRGSIESAELEHVTRSRRSSRTGQTHGLGGFTGHAIYSGELAPFWPWLKAAEWTGVGRQTVWGKGAIRVTKLDP